MSTPHEPKLVRIEIELNDLEWDSGFGDRQATINATCLVNPETREVTIEDHYSGWIDQDGGDHAHEGVLEDFIGYVEQAALDQYDALRAK